MLYGPCVTCVYFMSNLFSVLSSQYFEKVFACGFIILFLCPFCFVVAAFICVLYIYDLFHILLLPLQTYGSMEVCVYIHVEEIYMTSYTLTPHQLLRYLEPVKLIIG
jgi:hypothetical protein